MVIIIYHSQILWLIWMDLSHFHRKTFEKSFHLLSILYHYKLQRICHHHDMNFVHILLL